MDATDMKFQVRLLHILPHAGGGVGAVLRAILKEESSNSSPYLHSIASLDYLNEKTKLTCENLSIHWNDNMFLRHRNELDKLIIEADIVLLHWWNHPYMTKILYDGLPKSRLIIWSHVNGFFPPQSFIPEIFEIPDLFIFSCRSSLYTKVVKNLSIRLKNRLRIIRSSSGIPEVAMSQRRKTGIFQIGYVGTVESVKMHHDFLGMCASARLPTPCLVAGGPAHEELRARTKSMGLADHFEILGHVSDPTPIFRCLHAFVYPLTRRHYGTGEQVLLEAMSFGAVPVVLNNPPEMEIVRHGETGLVASNSIEFTDDLRFLFENQTERNRLASQAYEFIIKECNIYRSIKALHGTFDEAMTFKKKKRRLELPIIPGISPGSPCHLSISSLGVQHELKSLIKGHGFEKELSADISSPTHGTPFHYLNMLGKDQYLEKICTMIKMQRQ